MISHLDCQSWYVDFTSAIQLQYQNQLHISGSQMEPYIWLHLCQHVKNHCKGPGPQGRGTGTEAGPAW